VAVFECLHLAFKRLRGDFPTAATQQQLQCRPGPNLAA
jgi:hypothetical protein